MRSMAAICAVALALACAAARAETPRSVFCVAVRTVPMLDQNNYVLGATGPVYMTPNFSTEMADDDLALAWRRYIAERHPVAYPGNPDDACHPANARRGLISAQHGDIRNLSVGWKPDRAPGH
jgi:hypothetical protein